MATLGRRHAVQADEAGGNRQTPLPALLVRRWAATSIDYSVLAMIVFFGAFLTAPQPEGLVRTAALGLCFAAAAAYFPVLEALSGRTAGKWMTGLVVVDEQGGRPTIGQTIIRVLTRLIEVNPLVGGLPAGLAVMFTRKRQRVGDILSHTYVLPLAHLRAARAKPGQEDVF